LLYSSIVLYITYLGRYCSRVEIWQKPFHSSPTEAALGPAWSLELRTQSPTGLGRTERAATFPGPCGRWVLPLHFRPRTEFTLSALWDLNETCPGYITLSHLHLDTISKHGGRRAGMLLPIAHSIAILTAMTCTRAMRCRRWRVDCHGTTASKSENLM
jgi:hypothetical protein